MKALSCLMLILIGSPAVDDRESLAELAARQGRPLVVYFGVPEIENEGWVSCHVAGPALGCVVYLPETSGRLTFAGTTNNPWCVGRLVDEQAEARGLKRASR